MTAAEASIYLAMVLLLIWRPAVCHSSYERLRSPVELPRRADALLPVRKVHSPSRARAGSSARTCHQHTDPRIASYHRSGCGTLPRYGPGHSVHHRTALLLMSSPPAAWMRTPTHQLFDMSS